jgi:hypothetical protein
MFKINFSNHDKYIKLLILILCIFSSCATTYQPADEHFEGGYRDKIADYELILKKSREEILIIYGHDILFEVSASGNSLADSSRIETILLGRCAELALNNNCDYFYILDSGGINSTTFNITNYGGYTTHSYSRSAIIYISKGMDNNLERPYNAKRYYENAKALPAPNGYGYITVQIIYDYSIVNGLIDVNTRYERQFEQIDNNIGFNVGFDFYFKENGFLGLYTKTYGLFNIQSNSKINNQIYIYNQPYFDWEWLGGVQFRIPNLYKIEPFLSFGIGFGMLYYNVPEEAIMYWLNFNDELAMPFVINSDIGARINLSKKINLIIDVNFSKYIFILNGLDNELTSRIDIMPAIGVSFKL